MFKLGSTRVRIDYRGTKSAGWIYVTIIFLSKSTKCDEGLTQDTAELINYSNNVYEI